MAYMDHHFIYWTCLIIGIAGLSWLGINSGLFKARSFSLVVSLFLGVLFFLLWDWSGIYLKIFTTNQAWVSGLYLGMPDLPIEELFFLTLLGLNALLLYLYFGRNER